MIRSVSERLVIVGVVLWLAAPAAGALRPVEVVEVGPAWSGHPVRFAIETAGERQYVAYYDAERRMTLAARRLDSTDWSYHRFPQELGWDSHNLLALAVDAAGFVHLAGNMHGDPLVYYRSAEPWRIERFERLAMVGEAEREVTYPAFLRGPDGALMFHYREGRSGDGVRIFNRYDVETRRWRRVLDRPLLDGGGRMSAYPSGPVPGPDGYYHLVWMWRDTPDGDTNHDLSHARSRDLVHWETMAGAPLALPLTPETAGVTVDPVPAGAGLAGIAFGAGWDGAGRTVVTYCRYGPRGRSQIFNARWEEGSWRVRQTSSFDWRWELGRRGTLRPEIAALPVEATESGLVQWFHHREAGEGGWRLDEATLQPRERLAVPAARAALMRVESDFPGMEVRELAWDRTGSYALRWETLPENRDRRRRAPLPEPTALRVVRWAPDESGGAAP